MAKPTKTQTKKIRSRRAILDTLKSEGPQDAAVIADGLEISAMAVRQHLYDLQEQGLVNYREEARAKGRPAKMWHLTEAAESYFPDAHSDLAVGLIASMRETFGEEGLNKLLEARAAEQIRDYRAGMNGVKDIRGKLAKLVEIRSREGYMAGVQAGRDGDYMFIENHCPICSAARTCTGLCNMELEVFQDTLGPEVSVEREEHILAGARRCAYRIKPV